MIDLSTVRTLLGYTDWSNDRLAQRPEWIAAFLEMKTVWHPMGR